MNISRFVAMLLLHDIDQQ